MRLPSYGRTNKRANVRVRTIWISDLHLGSRYARAADVLDFIKAWECEHLYLVGDIFDGWAMTRSWFWPQEHNDVVQKILRYSRKGTPITYIPGNHDAFAREFLDLQLGNIRVEPSAVHTLMDGRRLLVLHGDEFDGIRTGTRPERGFEPHPHADEQALLVPVGLPEA